MVNALLLLTVMISLSAADMLSGKWENQHDSVMELKAAEDGILTGTYKSGVSQPGPPVVANEFTGRYQRTEYGYLVSFMATFNITKKEQSRGDVVRHTNTVWNGQVYSDNPGTMKTTWLMVSEKAQDEAWLSTLVNQDEFNKTSSGMAREGCSSCTLNPYPLTPCPHCT